MKVMKKLRITERDHERYVKMSEMENRFREEGFRFIAGVDEAGRGPLAGPVCAAVCILDPQQPIPGLNDSKKISPGRRELLAHEIKDKALSWSVSYVSSEEIDRVNILEATKIAMSAAIKQIKPTPDLLLLDAIRLDHLQIAQRSIIHGDAEVNAIAAASILAKTERDHYMEVLAEEFPQYGFERHKGYGTKAHYEVLEEHGPCPEHRLSFLSKLKLGQSTDSALHIGHKAEEKVAAHLEAQAFRILEKNFSLPGFGEIDLIAFKNNTLYIIEVKARQESGSIPADEVALLAIDKRKKNKIRKLGTYYADSRGYGDSICILLAAACTLDMKREVKSIHFTEISN